MQLLENRIASSALKALTVGAVMAAVQAWTHEPAAAAGAFAATVVALHPGGTARSCLGR